MKIYNVLLHPSKHVIEGKNEIIDRATEGDLHKRRKRKIMKESDFIQVGNFQKVRIANRIVGQIMIGLDDIIPQDEFHQVIGLLTKWENDLDEYFSREVSP